MAKFYGVLLVALLTVLTGRAQTRLNNTLYTDSLKASLQRSTSDSDRAITAFRLSERLALTDSGSAARYLEQGRLAGRSYPYVRAVYHYYAAVLRSFTNPEQAEAEYLLADSLLSAFDNTDAWIMRSRNLHRYGALRQLKDDPKQFADIMINRAIPLARRAGDSTLIGKNYLGIANVFKNNGQFDVAEPYILTAVRVLKNGHGEVEQLISTYNVLAENYSLAGKNHLVKPVLDTIRALLAPHPDSEYWLDYYAAESLYYNNTREYTKALAGLGRGIPLARRLGRRYEEQRLQLQRFYALYETKNYAPALHTLQYLLEQPEMMRISTNRQLLYAGMADVYAGLGNTALAYQWQKRYSLLSDSIHTNSLKSEITALEMKFRNAEHQQKIAALEAASRQAALSGRNTRLTVWLLAAASVLLLAAIVFTVFYSRNNRKLAEQKEINYRQQLKEMEQQQQLATSHAMIEGEERERSRVARDLHDGLGGMLAGVKIKLSGMAAGVNGHTPHASLDGVISQLDSSVRELRRIARNMMPENLLKFGLETALRDLSESMSTADTDIHFQAFGIEKNIPVSTQVTIYRIVQEALSNAIRHAAASEVVLQCSQNGDAFFVTVEDNGKGFDTAAQYAGAGLSNIRNRVNYLQGKLDITSSPGDGTTINIELTIGDEA